MKLIQAYTYLTDIFNFIDETDTAIHEIENCDEIAGINNIEQLQQLEKNIQ